MKGHVYKLGLLFEEMAHELKEIAEKIDKTTTAVGATAGDKNVPASEGATTVKKGTSVTEASITVEEVDVTIEDIRAVLAEKSQDGLTSKVKELLTSFGANKLSAVKVEDYPRLFMEAKKLK